MPGTVETRELFSKKKFTKQDVKFQLERRLKAMAINSKIESDVNDWILITTWNVIGEND